MIWRIVPHQHCIPPPFWVFFVQVSHQSEQEDLHDLAVAVGLRQADVDLAVGVQAHDEGDPWCYLQVGYRVVVGLPAPFPSSEV